jgi:hypothetical protein
MSVWFWRNKLLLAPFLVPFLLPAFLLVEHVRGSVSLARYLRALSAQGEKMTAHDFMLPSPSPGENGAPEVLALVKDLQAGSVLPKSYPPRMKLTPAGHAVICFREEQWVDDKVTNHWEQLAGDLETNKVVLEKIQAALAKPVLNCEFDPTLGPRARFTHLPVPKSLAAWFGSRIELRLHEGKTRETLGDLVTEINLPRMLERDGIVISELVRVAIAAIARGDTWEALQAEGWTDDSLAQIQQAWEKQQFATPMVRALEGERVFAQSSYQLMRQSNDETAAVLYGMEEFFSEDERPYWEVVLKELPGGEALVDFLKKQVYCRLWRFAWMDQDHLHYLRYLQQLIALSRKAARDKSLQKIEPLVGDLALKFQNQWIYDRIRFFSVISVNSLSRTLTRALRAETERSLVLTAIALKRYTQRHGAPPESLNTLVPEFLLSVPVDYVDGQQLRFHRDPEASSVLYSVGEDGKDDGGDTSLRPDKTNLRMLWERKDVVWLAPASAAEVEAYRTARN